MGGKFSSFGFRVFIFRVFVFCIFLECFATRGNLFFLLGSSLGLRATGPSVGRA